MVSSVTDVTREANKLLHAISILPNVPINEPKSKIVKNETSGNSRTKVNIYYLSKLQGIEPWTNGLTGRRSASELQLLISLVRIELTT